ncbi:MAG: hypothetical protein FJW24_04730 [Acidimicrobiia bacterium]|nr:hypothetical protein [Acidimicrobiia bacterium]
MAKEKIQVGDRFITVSGYPTTWIVEREIHGLTVAQHFQLSQEGQPSRLKTLSEFVLLDGNQYKWVPGAASAAA